jgi:hypothetical protein
MRRARAQAALVIGTPICGTIFSNDEKICCENAGLRSDRSASKSVWRFELRNTHMAFLARLKDLLVAFVVPVKHGVFLDTTAYHSAADDRELCFSPRYAACSGNRSNPAP